MARLSFSAAVLLASAGECAAFVGGPVAGSGLRPSLRAATCPTPIVMAAEPASLSRREVCFPWTSLQRELPKGLADLGTHLLTRVERGADGFPASSLQAFGALAVAGAWVRPHPAPRPLFLPPQFE